MTTPDRHPHRSLPCALACVLAACAGASSPTLRFANRATVRHVDDRRPIPKPAEEGYGGYRADVESFLRDPVLHALSVPDPSLAGDVNALDEVPDSTWFTNRIGVRDVAPDEIARGPGGAGPSRTAPWVIRSRKGGGSALGFVVEDVRGDRYILKLDPPGAPELESSAEAIVSRLLWAAGYNVPENHVVHFERGDLRVAPDAVQKLPLGEKVPLGERDVDATLAVAPRAADGRRWRAMASKYLDGVPIGGFANTGVRADDPNDRVPHEHRRSVRGQAVFFAWLGQTDVKRSNTLDTWVPVAKDADRGVVVHHILDFGKALGTWARDGRHEHDGFAAHFDYGYATRSLASFGAWKRPWEGLRTPPIRGIGRFTADGFDPAHYTPASPYPPFFEVEPRDGYWAAKIIARFERDQLEAAVRQGLHSDSRAAPYLVEVLLARRRAILAHWFGIVNPVDAFEVFEDADGVSLCATDLALRHDVARAEASRYRWRAHDANAQPLGWEASPRPDTAGRLCTRGLTLPAREDGYAKIALRTTRDGIALPDVIVHVARDPRTGTPRVVGLERR